MLAISHLTDVINMRLWLVISPESNRDVIAQQPCINDKLVTSLLLINIPRVLHGGSGNKDSEVAESIRYGVGKINISSDMKKAFFVALEQELTDHPEL